MQPIVCYLSAKNKKVAMAYNGKGFVSVPEFEKQMLKIYSKLK